MRADHHSGDGSEQVSQVLCEMFSLPIPTEHKRQKQWSVISPTGINIGAGKGDRINTKTDYSTGSPSAICVGSGLRGHLVEFGRNILELLVYYLMLNKCKNLKDMKSSCLSVCTSSLYNNEGRYFLHYYM